MRVSSLVLLVRHGQASFGAQTYDELSPLGERQAQVLGQSLRERGLRVDRVLSGALRRQRHTADLLTSQWDSAPRVEIDPGWDEFDHDQVVAAYDPAFSGQHTAMQALRDEPDPHRAFQRIFLAATARWQDGDNDDYAETFAAFTSRCEAALERASDCEGVTLVVTSGGPIAAAASAALGGDATLWPRLNEVVVNTGVTKLLGSRQARPAARGARPAAREARPAARLLTFNDHSHLEHDRSLITYR